MVKKLDEILTDIEQYCSVNGIENVEGFVSKCVTDGFSIAKYGLSPRDNKARENASLFQKPANEEKRVPVTVDIVSARVDSDGSLLFSVVSSDGNSYDVRKLPSDLPDLPLKKQRKIKEKING